MTLLDDLKADVTSGRTVAILGTGTSIQATDNAAAASWPGLLRAGIRHAVDTNGNLPPNWEEVTESQIAMGLDGYTPGFVQAAEAITSGLGGRDGTEFSRWLTDAYQDLTVVDGSVLDAIAALARAGVPIATTNYDTLASDATGLPTVTWRDPQAVQAALVGERPAIVHLHGCWREAQSVVFGAESYGGLLSSESAQAIERAMAVLRSFLLVGVGEGIDDPNFGALRDWLTDIVPGGTTRHYLLCRNDKRTELSAKFAGEQLTPVPYGATHRDLGPFVTGLVPTDGATGEVVTHGVSPALAIDRAVGAITELTRVHVVLADHLLGLDTRSVHELLVAPVLLPVTHEQFTAHDDNDQLKRCDPHEEATREGVTLMASERGVGLTSALQWMVSTAAEKVVGAVPVVVDFRRLPSGKTPFEKEIRKELSACGALAAPNDPLPQCVIAVDNVDLARPKVLGRLINEINDLRLGRVIVGCREGSEQDLVAAFRDGGISATVRYIGRMSRKDIRALASLVDPSRAKAITKTVMDVTSRERLVRTPFTVGLMISVLLHGETLINATSPTSLLDAYVNLLLGRGEAQDDSRFGLDSMERVAILSNLAEEFVGRSQGALTESDAIKCLETHLDALGWDDDPMEVLNSLADRHILVVGDRAVRFAQTTFLHLFAAKQAIESKKLREQLLARPLYYGPVIAHYAALTRNDAELVEQIQGLLVGVEEAGSSGIPHSLFAKPEPAAVAARSAEEVVGELNRFAEMPLPPDEDDDDDDDRFDRFQSDSQLEPFPLDDIDSAPPMVQLLSLLSLVSRVIRDSELIKDVDLKTRSLDRVLRAWATAVDLLSNDTDYQAFIRDLAEALTETVDMTDEERERFASDFVQDSPLLIGLAGISDGLSSRKLLRSLDRCLEDDDWAAVAGPSIMGACLAFDIQQRGWTAYLRPAFAQHGTTRAVRHILRNFMILAYRSYSLHPDDEKVLLEILADVHANEIDVQDERARKALKNEIRQRLRDSRRASSRDLYAPGETFLSAVQDQPGLIEVDEVDRTQAKDSDAS